MIEKGSDKFCLCGSQKHAARCCQLLLSGELKAKTPVKLMRSRYVAFAKGGYGDYLYNTWLPERRAGLDPIELSQKQINWCRLDVLSKSQQGDEGYVEFKAYYLDDEQNEQVHHEHSRFKRVKGRWYYVSEV